MRFVHFIVPATCAAAVLSSPSSATALDVSIGAFRHWGQHALSYGAHVQVRVPFERWFSSDVPPLHDAGAADGPESVLSPSAFAPIEDLYFDSQLVAEDPLLLEPANAIGQSTPEPDSRHTEAPAATPPSNPPPSNAQVAPQANTPAVAASPRWVLAPSTLAALVDATLRNQTAAELRLLRLGERARSSAWLPELKVRAGRNTDQTLRLAPTTDDPDRWQLTGGADLRVEGEVRWQFDRLVFASEEVSVERLRLAAEQQRARWVERVLDWVFRWQSATARRYDRALSDEQQLQATLQAEQAASALDVLSGGWFSRHVVGAR